MKSSVKALATLAICAAAFAATPVSAKTYFFSQQGFSGGGSLSGYFVGEDLNADREINTFFPLSPGELQEVTEFSLTFSGDSLVRTFSHSLSDLNGFVFRLGAGRKLGDDEFTDPRFGPIRSSEGIASNWFGTAGFDYAAGVGPAGLGGDPYGLQFWQGGRVIDVATGAVSLTTQAVIVSNVPEPQTYALMLAGLGLLFALSPKPKAA
jgi:hypothetical protein